MDKYVITDGSAYIYKNKKRHYCLIPKIEKADLFSEKMAKSILGNSIPKAMRDNLRVEKVNLQTEPIEVSHHPQINMRIPALYENFMSNLEKEEDNLSEKLSEIDMVLQDLMHYAEFNNLNAADGYKTYKMIHNARLQRREIKNQLEVLWYAMEMTEESMVKAENRIESQEKKRYSPRALPELFGR